MRDILAGRSFEVINKGAIWVGETFTLPVLPLHVNTVLACGFGYHFICAVLSPILTRRFMPKLYASFPRRTQLNWHVHVVSLVQSLLITTVGFLAVLYDPVRKDFGYRERVWGYTESGGLVQAMATGYFLWDLYITLKHLNIFGLGLLAHAICALMVYGLGYRPFVNWYAPPFIIYELSSPFLNVHWFCDKLNMTGSILQLINGIILITTFFFCRLVWGTYNSITVFYDIFRVMRFQETAEGKLWMADIAARFGETFPTTASLQFMKAGIDETWVFPPHPIPMWLAVSYLGANLVLNGLNVYWIGKMIATLRARFEEPWGTKPKGASVIVTKSIDDDGSTTVEVQSFEVKQKKGTTTRRRA